MIYFNPRLRFLLWALIVGHFGCGAAPSTVVEHDMVTSTTDGGRASDASAPIGTDAPPSFDASGPDVEPVDAGTDAPIVVDSGAPVVDAAKPVDSATPPPVVDAGPVTVCQILSQLTHPDVPCPTSGVLVWTNQAKGTGGYCGPSGWVGGNCPVDAWCEYQSDAGALFTGRCVLAP